MSDRGWLFLVSVVLVLASLGAAVWLVVTGQETTVDGLFLLLTCLLVAFAFSLYVAFAIRRAMEELAKPPAPAKKAPAESASKQTAAPAAAVKEA